MEEISETSEFQDLLGSVLYSGPLHEDGHMLLLQVAKGIAFSRTFTTLRDMTEENYIDPSR